MGKRGIVEVTKLSSMSRTFKERIRVVEMEWHKRFNIEPIFITHASNSEGLYKCELVLSNYHNGGVCPNSYVKT